MEAGYWGKYCVLKEGTNPRKIWIGPMTREEMIENFPEFRHSFRPDAPSVEKKEVLE